MESKADPVMNLEEIRNYEEVRTERGIYREALEEARNAMVTARDELGAPDDEHIMDLLTNAIVQADTALNQPSEGDR